MPSSHRIANNAISGKKTNWPYEIACGGAASKSSVSSRSIDARRARRKNFGTFSIDFRIFFLTLPLGYETTGVGWGEEIVNVNTIIDDYRG